MTSFQREREALGHRLRELRRDARLTGRQLAEAQRWQPSKVSRIESGKQTPSDADVEVWATAFLPVADDGQDLVGIVGYRNTAGYTDALWVFGEDDCRAVRRHAPKLVRARLLLPDRPATGMSPGGS